MELQKIEDIVEENYELHISSIEKIKNAFKLSTAEGKFCLKPIPYEYGHFLFILSAIKHLQDNNFKNTPEIIKNINNRDFIQIEDKFAYITKWITARECNYDNPVDLDLAVSALAELHKKSEGFEISSSMKPRIGWFKWFENFETRGKEILDFKARIGCKSNKTYFDSLYESILEEELDRVENTIKDLKATEYLFIMKSEIEKKGFCHHDIAHHNVLITEADEVNIIDFDYCILDTHLHDLSSILIRRLKNGKWEFDEALKILDCYNEIYRIKDSEIPVMASFMEFPQEYWQLGIQYYWEKKPWEEDYFVNKLLKIIEDRELRQDFLFEFMECKYKGGSI